MGLQPARRAQQPVVFFSRSNQLYTDGQPGFPDQHRQADAGQARQRPKCAKDRIARTIAERRSLTRCRGSDDSIVVHKEGFEKAFGRRFYRQGVVVLRFGDRTRSGDDGS